MKSEFHQQHRRRIATKREHFREAERLKSLLAKSVLSHMLQVQDMYGDEVPSFSYRLDDHDGHLERYVLTHYPEDITRRINFPRSFQLQLDQSTEPPRLSVIYEDEELEI